MKKFLLFFLISFFCKNALAQINFTNPNFSFTIVSDGWVQPMGAAYTADAQQLFVWEKRGNLFVCNKNGNTYTRQETPVINLTGEILNYSDFGLLGVALDPDYLSNGFVYLLYVVDRRFLMNDNSIAPDAGTGATIGRVTRYKTALTGGQLSVDPASRTILIGENQSTGIPILHDSHGVGSLVFAADGTLLLSAGDAATYNGPDNGNDPSTFFAQALSDGIIRSAENVGAFRAQLLNSHNGKLLRIDPATGNGVTSNPFYDGSAPRSPKSRVWALGFRNPFRFIVRPGTGSTNPLTGDIGEILVGDVGWEDLEELNIVTGPGMNFGWPVYDGLEINPEYAADAATTENIDEPNPLTGTGGCTRLFFTFGELVKQPTADANMTLFSPCDPSVAIGTGNRYVHKRPALDFGHTVASSRVGIFSGNNPAVADIGTPESGVTGAPFMGSCVVAGMWYTGDNFPPEYRDKFFMADWTNSWVKHLSIDYTDAVTRVDNFATDFKWVISMAQNPVDGTVCVVNMDFPPVGILEYGGNQPPVAKPVATGSLYGVSPLTINFSGNTSFDPSPGGSIVSYAWDFGGGAPATGNVASPGNVVFSAPPGTAKKFVVKLTVTDNGGATHTDSIIVSVNNTPPVVHITSPANSTYVPGPPANYACTATVSDAEHNGPGELTYEWQTFLRHNTHQHAGPIDNNVSTTTKIDRIGCNGDTYYWLIHLKVTDAAGLSTADSVKLFPDCNVGPDILPPTVLSVDPVNGTTEINTSTPVSADFNESIDPATVTGTTFQLKDAGNNVVTASINVNPLSNQIILTPSAALTNSAIYTATITSGAAGVKDLSGNALATDYIWSFTTVAADNVPPTVTSVLPLNGAAGVATNATATINFNEPIDASTATVTTVQLKDAGNNIIPAGISTSTNQIVVTPSAALTNSMTYTVIVTSGALGVKDLAGNALASDYSWSFTTTAAGTTINILPSADVPESPLNNDFTGGIALGVKFRSTQNGFITGVRYYKGAGATGVHIGQLWTAAGANLAQATFTNETASGWQQVLFSSPVAITAGVTYVASYYSPSGDYASTENYFAQAVVNDPLRGLADGEDGVNGLYKYTALPEMPNAGYLSTNYWVDVLFTTIVDVTAPIVASTVPANAATGISTSTTVSANFNETIDVATVNGTTFQLKDASDNIIPASITVNAASNQIMLTPSALLSSFNNYTATIKSGAPGIKDLAGNALASDMTWSFTTGAGTLPILLHKFSVTQNGAVNLIKWTTELESEMEYFELERSTNGVNFEPINRQAASNTPGSSHYSFADNSFSAGMNYYRLKMVEYGGVIEYSVIVRVVSGSEITELKVLPNPVTGNFSLSYHSLRDDKVTLEINDISGRLVHTLKESVNKGQNIIYIKSQPGWHAGVYSISVKSSNETKQVKFVKIQ